MQRPATSFKPYIGFPPIKTVMLNFFSKRNYCLMSRMSVFGTITFRAFGKLGADCTCKPLKELETFLQNRYW